MNSQKFKWFSKPAEVPWGLTCSLFARHVPALRISYSLLSTFPTLPTVQCLPGHVCCHCAQSCPSFSSKPSGTLSFAVLRDDNDSNEWEEVIAPYQSSTCCLMLVMGFTWYPLLACLRQIKWEARQYWELGMHFDSDFKWIYRVDCDELVVVCTNLLLHWKFLSKVTES